MKRILEPDPATSLHKKKGKKKVKLVLRQALTLG